MTIEVAAPLNPNFSTSRQESELLPEEWEILDPVSDRRWDQLAASHPDCNIFHSSAWARVLCKTYRHTPLYLHLSQASRTLGLVPIIEVASTFTGRRGVCLPFTDFAGPLLFDESSLPFVVRKLSDIARQRNWKYFEFRGGNKPSISAVPAEVFYGHKLDLRHDNDQLFAGLASSVRRAVRKAEKSNLTVEVTRTPEALNTFYGLHVKTRKRHGLPPQPLSFFLNIYEEILKQNLGFVVLAQRESLPVAAAVFFHAGKSAIYKYGASDVKFQEFRGNDLVMWEAIKFLTNGGATTLHFGRTSPDGDGLRRFKLAWGTVEEAINYFKFDPRANSWLSGGSLPRALHKQVFGRLPLKLNQLAGSMIYPHLD